MICPAVMPFGHTIRTLHFIPSNLATKIDFGEVTRTMLDWGLHVTVIFFFSPPPFSAAQQTKHEVALPLSLPSSKPGMKQEGSVFSYWELVYSGTSKSFGWMPLFERAPWGKQPPGLVQRWQSNHSSRGVFEYFAASENKLHGLDCHGNWAGLESAWSGWKGTAEETRRRESACLSAHRLTHKNAALTNSKCQFTWSISV